MSKKNLIICSLAVLILASSLAFADPVVIIPTSEDGAFVPQITPHSDITVIETAFPEAAGFTLTLLYKQNVGGSEEGSFAGSYTTVFSPSIEPSSATITHVLGESVITNTPLYLVIKDGAAGNYVFDLRNLTSNVSGVTLPYNWNGIDQIVLNGFWEGTTGSISHVSIFGGTSTSVPEPTSLILLGAGLLGMGLLRRKSS